ncbi:chloramphenicol acetyltransferase [Sphingobacterium psychroaquaticum]|uniref:Chloramphenicol O-acetyltransferase type A n=1 Tax=Sphingobacterium psychroaquaticum TaxID=561061 RepID=A0A1X7JQJ7_9SPHI|nr:chloramphenicol acetyltransferase [Sphingobacterium psychroaquaticum]SMG29789.1 chloramphenicol O-acetyltransferase type A [Sphingobacterium psychroaquaticum]
MKKHIIDINGWSRREQYLFFSTFEEPFFGIISKVDCTQAYDRAKVQNKSFFLYYLYRVLQAANAIENFRYQIIEEQPYCFEKLTISPTIGRANETFGFAIIDYEEDEELFIANANKEIDKVKNTNTLFTSDSNEKLIHFSALPWIDFTGLSHARRYSTSDSCPKISVGKVVSEGDRKTMAISVHVHHALVDGMHVGLFLDQLQALLNE